MPNAAPDTKSQPFDALPSLPDTLPEAESASVLKAAILASRQLAELKGSCLRLPDPALLLNTIVLQESRDSSAIENIVTTQDELYQAILSPNDAMPAPVKEVLMYREAIYTGLEYLKTNPVFKGQMAIQIMQRLRALHGVGYRSLSGTKVANSKTKEVIYFPPSPSAIPEKMQAWERFINENEDLDPLLKMAMMHYQFEAIHPFADGNGRTGRILNVLYLIHEKLITEPVLYHSSYIIQHKDQYYRGLQQVTEEQAWGPWLHFMLDAVRDTARNTCRFIEQLMAAKDRNLHLLKGISQKVPSYELNELLFSYPYLKTQKLLQQGLGSRPTVAGYLERLVEKKVLTKVKIGRENYYINQELMDMLSLAAHG